MSKRSNHTSTGSVWNWKCNPIRLTMICVPLNLTWKSSSMGTAASNSMVLDRVDVSVLCRLLSIGDRKAWVSEKYLFCRDDTASSTRTRARRQFSYIVIQSGSWWCHDRRLGCLTRSSNRQSSCRSRCKYQKSGFICHYNPAVSDHASKCLLRTCSINNTLVLVQRQINLLHHMHWNGWSHLRVRGLVWHLTPWCDHWLVSGFSHQWCRWFLSDIRTTLAMAISHQRRA